jgi:sigma-B regulation protein RsbU (phosphoserine phosphatase)
VELPTDRDAVDVSVPHDRYQLALEAGRMGTWHWAAADDRLDWDEPMMHVFGVEPGTFAGTFGAYLALLHPDDVAHTVATVEESLRTGRDHYVEHRVLHPDGTLHWVSGTGRVLTDENGTVTGMVGIGADITERHAQQEARLAAEAATEIARNAAAEAESRLALLGRIGGVLGGSLDVRTTLQQVADLIVQEHLADWCVVEIPGGERGIHQLALAHRDPEMVALAARSREEYPPELREDRGLGKVLRTGEPELWPTIPAELLAASARDEAHRELLENLQLSAAMIVPLAARGVVLGAISLIGTAGRSFDEDDLGLAVEVGTRAGVALDNARLYADRDTVARTLQQSLLPTGLPDIPDLDLAALHRPGQAALGVGGDFYDAFPVGDGSWCLVIGDVCGKGVEAAAFTAAVRYAVRTAGGLTASPADVLSIVNATLLREDWSGRFATLVLVRVEQGPTAWHLTVASAGHPAPMLRRLDGTVEHLTSDGTIVGILPEATFTQTRAQLHPGDSLLLFTDGLTEAGAPAALFGVRRLAAAFRAAAGSSAGEIAAEVLSAVEEYRSARLSAGGSASERDDMAVLVATAR